MSRPRMFDEEQALDQAMRLFWRHGYDGTSLSALTDAMGINRPSLYAAFGNKASLFRRAVQRYVTGPGRAISAALQLPTARQSVEELLRVYSDAVDDHARPLGCFVVNGAMSCSPESEAVRGELAAVRAGSIDALKKRIERGQRKGELAAGTSPASLARYYWAVLNGMAIQASDGATRAQLREVGRLALATWPAA